ncbi:MAG: alpha/beta hydrolase [Anaerolineales bacterium]
MILSTSSTDPHRDQPLLTSGEPLIGARAAMIMIHGRGARAENILETAQKLPQTGVAYLAPQAAGDVWYPNRFLAPLADNEPWLSSALARIESVLAQVAQAGLSPERTLLLGFSQGACLTLEFAARHARRYGGVIGLSGGLIGPDGTPHTYPGSLAGTPVFLGCSDVDFHIPKKLVHEAAQVFRRLGGNVTERLYPNHDHSINQDEIEFVRSMMNGILDQ